MNVEQMKHNNTMPIVAGILSAIIIGFSFLFLKNIVSVASPLSILSFRFTIKSFLFYSL